jgi:hypothetical protein
MRAIRITIAALCAQREGGRRARDDQAVHEIGREPLGIDDGGIVAPVEMLGDEHRRIGGVVDLEFDRQRQHPEEEQHRRRHDHEQREAEADSAEPLPQRAHAMPPLSFQCVL